MMRQQLAYNIDKDNCCRCIKAGYYKMGLGNCLNHPDDGFTAPCVLEFEIEPEDNLDIKVDDIYEIPTISDDNTVNVAQATKTGYIKCPVGGILDMSYPKSKLRRGRVQGNGQISPTLTCNPENLWIIDSIFEDNVPESPKFKVKKVRVRKLTERECFRLMGLKDEDIDKLLDSDLSKSALYKMAGNSIVVDVLTEIFRTMFVEQNSEKGQAVALF